MPNRLINETSPYLLQHAHNPVDWRPWGQEALDKAQTEDKPILLSIGYSACHWCHVMERESFEDERIAGMMNDNFVSIKVDREERPDIDNIYMNAVQALTGNGGWPLTVFLTPDGRPFYGGTYFPPDDNRGMVSFPRLLSAMADAYRNKRGDVIQATQQLLEQVRRMAEVPRAQEPLSPDVLHQAFQNLVSNYDFQNGGFGSAPKFPQPMTYEFILRYHKLTNSPRALEMVELAASRMATGGIYDQIGGGFHRYSTDPYWLVPHFEKMLYDNALLVRLFLHLFQATRNEFYRRIAEETLDYVIREMRDPAGGFYSSQDADSEGEEGKFFVWSKDELALILGEKDADLTSGYWGVSDTGNFEGRNILNVLQGAESYAAEAGISPEALAGAVSSAKAKLMEARERRIHPGRDDKALTAWNGMTLRSFAEAASILERDDYRQAATDCAEFLLRELVSEGRLLRTYKDGKAHLNGYLEDYAYLADGLLYLYEATFDDRWLNEARHLADGMIDLFWEQAENGFYDTGRDHEDLVVRPRDVFDNATPCGSSVAVDMLLRLSVFTGDGEYSRRASSALRAMRQYLIRAPNGMGHWLCALDFYLSTPKEIAIVGDLDDPSTKALLRTVHGGCLPNKVLAGASPEAAQASPASTPLLEGRTLVDKRPTAYVCQNYVCQLPVTDPESLERQLED